METCRRCRSGKSSGCSRHLISGLRASVPVPEHGTSASARSKLRGQRQSLCVRRDDAHIARPHQAPSQPCARRVQLGRDHQRSGIQLGHGGSLASGRSAAIQDATALPDQQSDELRGFVLQIGAALGEDASLGHVTRSYLTQRHATSSGHECAWGKFDAFFLQFQFGGGIGQAQCRHRNFLVVARDLLNGLKPVLRRPAFQKPQRVRGGSGDSGKGIFSAFRRTRFSRGKPAHDRIHHRRTESPAGSFDQFNRLIDGGMRRNPLQVCQLIGADA